jgi:hypothetical protein
LHPAERLFYAAAIAMNVWLTLLHQAVMTAKLCGPGGVRAVIAENLVLKQQRLVLRRGRQAGAQPAAERPIPLRILVAVPPSQPTPEARHRRTTLDALGMACGIGPP